MINKLSNILTALHELGIKKLVLIGLYRLGLNTGFFPTKPASYTLGEANTNLKTLFSGPDVNFYLQNKGSLTLISQEADLITKGVIKYFGELTEHLDLRLTGPLQKWTTYERGQAAWETEDIKMIWEPARFSWAIKLARAYKLFKDEKYAKCFWQYFEDFCTNNPPYMGPNWLSAQECAIRVLAMIFAFNTFNQSPSSTPQMLEAVKKAISDHAQRILPTMIYARAQNNNHLLSEAVGLYSAGIILKDHPKASLWRKKGWKWFNQAIKDQINQNGTYIQHSTTYHRLMLHLALWMFSFSSVPGVPTLPKRTLTRLAAATRWLKNLIDENSGLVPNLGANDGSLLLTLTNQSFEDYRPTLQAASRAFLKQDLLPAGPWDELSEWLGLSPCKNKKSSPTTMGSDMQKLVFPEGYAFFRTARFKDRPSHADQLHVDIWYKGRNLTLDPGTFSYNTNPPWENALAVTSVHNTLTLDEKSQMTRASKFLWLHWAQAKILERQLDSKGNLIRITAQHDGYRRDGWQHKRTVYTSSSGQLNVEDVLIRTNKQPKGNNAQISWLFPDLTWQIIDHQLTLDFPEGQLRLIIQGAENLSLIRAGECLRGTIDPAPFMGWYSPTYNMRIPALQLIARSPVSEALHFNSHFKFI